MMNRRKLLEEILKGNLNRHQARAILGGYSLKATELFSNVFEAEICKNGILEEVRKMTLKEAIEFKKQCVRWILIAKDNEWISIHSERENSGSRKTINVTLNID